MMKKKEILQSLLKLVVIVFAATVLGKVFTKLGFPETNIVVMYLLAVLLVARFTSGYQYGILSVFICSSTRRAGMNECVCIKYFFTPSTMYGIITANEVRSPPAERSKPT